MGEQKHLRSFALRRSSLLRVPSMAPLSNDWSGDRVPLSLQEAYMQKWEYKVLSRSGGPDKVTVRFNKLGDEGWELVAVDELYAHFRRPKSEISN